MNRLFREHEIRPSREADALWTMRTPDAGGLETPVKVVVPGVVEAVPGLKNYRGRAVFEQDIACGGNVRFWFGGVSFKARVWLDDAPLAHHYGAYTGFEALALNVAPGAHTLRVEADNRFTEDSALHVPNDYYAYGGITRPVTIEALGDVYLTSMEVRPRRADGLWRAEIRAGVRNLSGEAQALTLRVEIPGLVSAEIPVALPPHKASVFSMILDCPDAPEWSPEHPALCEVRATLLRDGAPVDDLIDRFGFREVRVDGARILLNGAPIRLKGFNRHEDCADFGCAVPLEVMARDVQLMADMGCNCVRTCHYPNDPRFLDLCDECGLLVWEEAHTRGFDEAMMRHPRFMEQLTACTREMVAQHVNHPCIFVWGCLNECADDTEYGAECYREIFDLLRALDDTRPVTAALLEHPGGQVFGDMDVVGVNLYPLWYHDTPPEKTIAAKIREIREHGGADKPILISEIGAGAIYGCRDPFGEAKWSEERQCAILRRQLEAVLSSEDCSGVFIWQFADVRVDESWAMRRPRTFNNKGVVDEYRRPKLACQVVRELFKGVK